MVAFSISLKASDESPIIAVLSRIAGFNKTQLFEEIGAYGVTSTQFRFADQHDVNGNPWKQSWRAKAQNGQTGRDTGALMNSLNYQVLANGVEWGSDVEYAHVFHFGAHIVPKTAEYLVFNAMGSWRKVKEVNIPGREFLGINEDDESSILDIVGAHILG